jgi:hypothetical protein
MEVRKIPRGTFLAGALASVALVPPLLALALEAVAHTFHVGPGETPRARILVFAAAFAGLPIFVTGGGVARLVAHRLVESASARAVSGVVLAAIAMGIAGIGAALLTVVPLGDLPDKPVEWWPLLLAGLVSGVVAGIAVGILVGGRTLRHRQRAAGAGAGSPE